jgi:hypothetical protein
LVFGDFFAGLEASLRLLLLSLALVTFMLAKVSTGQPWNKSWEDDTFLPDSTWQSRLWIEKQNTEIRMCLALDMENLCPEMVTFSSIFYRLERKSS